MKTYFDIHVFHNELEAKLLRLVDRSDRLPPFIILYGEPGTGKTSFAKWFAEEYASCMNYFPINETGLNKEVWHKISRCHTTASLYDEGKPISRLVILDEFHNATRNQQDKFKTLYDQISERDIGDRFIFVLIQTRESLENRFTICYLLRCTPECIDCPLMFQRDSSTKS